MPEWLLPTLVGVLIAVLGYLAKGKLDSISKESSQSLGLAQQIQSTMIRPSDISDKLEIAVLRMAQELDVRFSQKFYSRQEADRLQEDHDALHEKIRDVLRRTPIG